MTALHLLFAPAIGVTALLAYASIADRLCGDVGVSARRSQGCSDRCQGAIRMTSDAAESDSAGYHTDNPTDIKLTQEQVEIIEGGGVLMMDHALCGRPIRLWKEVDDDE